MRVVQANGFLWIGDPHNSSRRPTRRRDQDFMVTALTKFELAISIANELNLVAVIEGDLTDEGDDTRAVLVNNLIRILKQAIHKPVHLLANHDLTVGGAVHAFLTDDHLLTILKLADVVQVIEHTGPALILDTGAIRVGLGGTPYRQDVPTDVRGLFTDEAGGVDKIVWVTHLDGAFDGAYPGSMELFEIPGCSLVVNGHMHTAKPAVVKGETTWFNTGNIVRQSIDLAMYRPSVWVHHPDSTERHADTLEPAQIPAGFTQRILPHLDGSVVFDLNGWQAEAQVPHFRAVDGLRAVAEGGAGDSYDGGEEGGPDLLNDGLAPRRSTASFVHELLRTNGDRERAADAGDINRRLHAIAREQGLSPTALEVIGTIAPLPAGGQAGGIVIEQDEVEAPAP